MDINLEKIDIIRERLDVSYKEAKEALENANGNVVEALVALEEKPSKNWTEDMGTMGNDIIEKLKNIIKKGNVTRVILKKDGEVLLNIPVTAGAVGVILAPLAALFGVSAALITKTKIEIVKNDGQVMDLNEMAEDQMGELKRKLVKKDDISENHEEISKEINEKPDQTDEGSEK